jgi:hypothetical protein
MKDWKYILAMAGIVAVEIGLGYGLYRFALATKVGFCLFAAAVFGGFVYWQVSSSYREQVKLHDRKIVRRGYLLGLGYTVAAIAVALAVIIIVRAGFAFSVSIR